MMIREILWELRWEVGYSATQWDCLQVMIQEILWEVWSEVGYSVTVSQAKDY